MFQNKLLHLQNDNYKPLYVAICKSNAETINNYTFKVFKKYLHKTQFLWQQWTKQSIAFSRL